MQLGGERLGKRDWWEIWRLGKICSGGVKFLRMERGGKEDSSRKFRGVD